MSAINPVTSNAALVVSDLLNIYTCPGTGKSHAVVDISIFKPNTSLATLSVYITTTVIGSLGDLDAITNNTSIIDTNGSFIIEKAIVGPGESVFVKSTAGAFNVRLAGVEEDVLTIHNAGRLAAVLNSNNTSAKIAIFKPTTLYAGAVLALGSLSVYNKNAADCLVDLYISTGTSPVASDYVNTALIQAGKNAVFSNLLVNANETIFVAATPNVVGINCVFNGFIQ